VKRISYAETVFGTDDRVADLVLEYARLLARRGSADTVTVPGRVGDGAVEPVSLLVGPASQITAWRDPEPFDGDVSAAVADLEGRIRALGAETEPYGPDEPGGGVDDFDELG
jgi:hypothetical protein